MTAHEKHEKLEKRALYDELAAQLTALLKGESDPIANAANTAALIYHGLPDLNWAGFYFIRSFRDPSPSYPHPFPPPLAGEGRGGGVPVTDRRELVLGPFQGKPACVRIPWGKGVCGTAAARGMAVIVPDVHVFPGHIACDANSRSELVVPLVKAAEVIGVLDLDSPLPARFDEEDRAGVERLAAILIASLG
jgi:L-methionine (R)-S-oxide reductase